MAVKISELTAAGSANATDQLEVNQSGTSRRVTSLQIADYVRGLAGTVRQVVYATPGTTFGTTTSTTYVDYGVSVNITPTSASSNILLVANFVGGVENPGNEAYGLFAIRTGSTVVKQQYVYNAIGGATNVAIEVPVSIVARHSPATTSVVSYKISLRDGISGSTYIMGSSDEPVDLFALEITA